MYGYVITNKPELKMKEFDEYRSFYCGLCDTLYQKFGRAGQLTLNFDCTFLLLLLDGLYEPVANEYERTCIEHPLKKHGHATSEVTDYAADMNLLLAWYKLVDDWKDEKSAKAYAASLLIRKNVKRIAAKYPKKAAVIEKAMKRLAQLERRAASDGSLSATGRGLSGFGFSASDRKATSGAESARLLDELAACFGTALAEICDYKQDEWSTTLRKLGFNLGCFIYLADAYDDRHKDEETGNFNPFLLLYKEMSQDDVEALAKTDLNLRMAECTECFEFLPILRHGEILRNILYSGVWQKLNLPDLKERP